MLKKTLVFALLGVAAAFIGLLNFVMTDEPAEAAMPAHNDTAMTQPRIACGSGSKAMFYGINGHIYLPGAYKNSSFAAQLSQLHDLGISIYRQDVSDAEQSKAIAQLAAAAKAQCIDVLVVLTPDYQRGADEAGAYQQGYQLAHAAALNLKGLVHYYEVGNEYDNNAILPGRHGNSTADFDNARFVKARGAILGMIDGVKSVDPSAKIVLCGLGWLHYGFSDMLHAGTQPDGSGQHRIPQWDITAWHWYSEMDDITAAGMWRTDVLKHLRDTYGKPIWITEFGVRPDNTEEAASRYLVGDEALGGYVDNARKYDIQSVEMYELYDDKIDGGDGNYGVIDHDGKTRKARYDVVKAFIQAHPDPRGG